MSTKQDDALVRLMPGIELREVGDQLAALDAAGDRLHLLEGLAVRIVGLLDEPRTLAELLELSTPLEVEAALAELESAGVVVLDRADGLTRRSLLVKGAAAGAAGLLAPVLTSIALPDLAAAASAPPPVLFPGYQYILRLNSFNDVDNTAHTSLNPDLQGWGYLTVPGYNATSFTNATLMPASYVAGSRFRWKSADNSEIVIDGTPTPTRTTLRPSTPLADVLNGIPAGQTTIVRWKCAQNGKYTIYGRFEDLLNSTNNAAIPPVNDDGVSVSIVGPTGTRLAPLTTIRRGATAVAEFNLTDVSLTAGQFVYFTVSAGSGALPTAPGDLTDLHAIVTYVGP